MKLRWIALFLFFGCSIVSFGQDSEVDSIALVIQQQKQKDTARVENIVQYVIKNEKGTSPENQALLDEALQLSKELNYKVGEGKVYNALAEIYAKQSNAKMSLEFGIKAEQIFSTLPNAKDDLIVVNSNLARAYLASKDYEKALAMYQNNIELVKNDEANSYKGRLYILLGNAHNRLKQHEEAIEAYLQAKAIASEINDERSWMVSNGSLANIYNNDKQFEKALPIALEVMEFSQKTQNEIMIGATHKVLAETYLGLKQYGKGIEHGKKAELIFEKLGRLRLLEDVYKYLGQNYEGKGDFENSLAYHKKYYITHDSIFSKDRALIVEELKTKYETEKIEQEKDLAEANASVAKEKAKRSRTISWISLIFAGIVSLLIAYIFNRLQLIRKQKAEIDSAYGKLDEAYIQLEEAKKNELAVSNLKALQSQMNPHFIFNALNSVQDLVLLKDIRSSNKYLGKFSDLIRKILLSSKKQFITLEEEVEILGLYLDLEKLRFGDDFKVDFEVNVPEELQEQIEIPAMFIQPYIENAIKHGLFHKTGEKHLKVAFSLGQEDLNGKAETPIKKEGLTALQCIIQDNGVGAEKAAELKVKNLHLHTGFSTEAINERIRLLNETLEHKISLKIEDLHENGIPKGMKITLLFPTQIYIEAL